MQVLTLKGKKGSSNLMNVIVFTLGGIAYGLIEVLYRGHTHWSMCLTGGACVLTFFFLRELLFSLPLLMSALIGALIVTVYEFSVGIVVNRVFQLNVWDYSSLPFNILGQICPYFFAAWFVLCFVFFCVIKFVSSL